MFNSTILDVAIGLVFIYLLYSLLATTVKEFIATIFSYRAKMLERGIEQMLDGKNYKYFWWNRLRDMMHDKKWADPSKKLLDKSKLFANEITSHSLFKRAAENGISDKPSYLPAETFSDILIDLLHANKNIPPLLKDIAAEIEKKAKDKSDPFNEELRQILTIYIQQANGDLQRFKLLTENWYDDMMGRVSGWYKRQANKILIAIGFCMAVAFNVSTIDIVDKLSTDKAVRDALVKNATAYINDHMDPADPTGAAKKSVVSQAASAKDVEETTDTTKGKGKSANVVAATDKHSTPDSNLAAISTQLDNMKALYSSNIEEENTTLGLGWGNYGFTNDTIEFRKDSMQYVLDLADFKNDSAAYCANHRTFFGACKKPSQPAYPDKRGIFGKMIYILTQTFFEPRNLIGFLITAFAISLGAPFWFDLLNKFINLRVSGAKPNESSNAPVSKTASLNQKPDPTAKG